MRRHAFWMLCLYALTGVSTAETTEVSDGKQSNVGYEDTKVGDTDKSSKLGISNARESLVGAVPTIADKSTQTDLFNKLRDSLHNKSNKSELLGDGENSSMYNLKHACHLEPDTGLCRAFIPRWYYNASDETCYKFTYGGCRGNENNFDKEHKCYATCKGEIPCPTDPVKVCRLSESPCEKANCPAHPKAECSVLPCTCEAVFEDSTGEIVDCNLPAIGDLSKTSYVPDIYEGRAARPALENKSVSDFEDYPQTTKIAQTPKTTTEVDETTTTNSDSKISPINNEEFIDEGDSDASVTDAKDEKMETVTENFTDHTTVTTTESAHNVTVPPPPRSPGKIGLIGVIATLAIIVLIALCAIAYKKWRGAMVFHYRNRDAHATEDRQCITSSGGAGYGSGI
ncbi:uncharacterized protein [Palaemon carinicauda]|uniref:uncharacterized protein n=1 Tax=Palaemon carinicauda TaxID=392227 RepID=UPI0035B5C233